MNKIILGLVIVIVVIAAGVYVFGKNNSSSTPTPSQTQITHTTPEATGQHAVTIQNFVFSPALLKVKVGEKVTWTNQDNAGHSATADDGSFDTGVLAQGQSGSITFSKPGTYAYHCSVHPSMKGTIIVE